MRHIKKITLTALAAMAVAAFAGAGPASATTLEVGGTTKNEAVPFTMSYKVGTSGVTRDTFGFAANTCNTSNVNGATEAPFSGTTVTGTITSFTFENCARPMTVHKPGNIHVQWTSGTNGTVSLSGAEWTQFSNIHGTYLNCQTGAGTVIGTLTGVKEGHATLDVNATLTCGPHLHSAKWTGSYTVTTPTGLGVSP